MFISFILLPSSISFALAAVKGWVVALAHRGIGMGNIFRHPVSSSLKKDILMKIGSYDMKRAPASRDPHISPFPS
jgi:hypothetical protein